MSDPRQRLAELGITLPSPPKPVASYVGYRVAGDIVTVSGQLPLVEGELRQAGRLGDGVDVEAGAAAARLCAINLLAQVAEACGGDLGRVRAVVRLGGFVASAPGFTDQPKVVNGASDLMAEVFGPEIGRHARAAVGVAALPLGASVEIEGTFLIAP